MQHRDRNLGWFAVALAGVDLVLTACVVVVETYPARWSPGFKAPQVGTYVGLVILVAAGSAIAWARPRNTIGWLLLGCSTALVLARVGSVAGYAGRVLGLPAADWLTWIGSWLWVPAYVLPMAVLPAIYPSGRPPSSGWRYLAWAGAVGTAGYMLTLAGANLPAPVAVRMPVHLIEVLSWFAKALIVVAVAGGAAATFASVLRARGPERPQRVWLLVAVAVSAVPWVTPPGVLPAIPIPVLASLGIAVAVGLLRYRLLGIETVLRRGVLYATLTAGVFGVYMLAAAVAGAALDRRPLPGVVAAAVVAAGLAPARDRLRRLLDRIVYGRQGDPAAAVTRLGTRLTTMLTPAEVPPAIVDVISESLGVRQVAVLARVDGELRPLASRGGMPDPETAWAVPLSGADGPVGRLLVGTRAPGEPLTRTDRRTVEQLARHAGPAVHAALLSTELRRARIALVLARDEERRRLRRDLHDGLGSYLAGITFGVDGVRRQVSEPQAAQLARIADQAAAATREVRRVIDDLRPGPLEQLGLLDALRDLADRTAGVSGLVIAMDCPPSLPSLPLPIELAAYQIASEALTNVVRHARATRCRLSVAVDPARLCLAVADNGVGVPATPEPGVGLASMRTRAAAVGGELSVAGSAEGGTAVVAELPLERPP